MSASFFFLDRPGDEAGLGLGSGPGLDSGAGLDSGMDLARSVFEKFPEAAVTWDSEAIVVLGFRDGAELGPGTLAPGSGPDPDVDPAPGLGSGPDSESGPVVAEKVLIWFKTEAESHCPEGLRAQIRVALLSGVIVEVVVLIVVAAVVLVVDTAVVVVSVFGGSGLINPSTADVG